MSGTLRRRIDQLSYPLGLRRRRIRRANRGNRDAVFIWIPKTAGQSIVTLLHDHGCAKLKEPYAVRHCFPQRGLVTFGHQSYTALVDQNLVTREFDRLAWKFCFVRNPFDRVVSLYTYLKQKSRITPSMDFRTFAHVLRDRTYQEIGLYNWKGMSQCNSQLSWIRDAHGCVFVDFVGRFENLEEDLATIRRELGIGGPLAHMNRGDRDHYRDYYDAETRRLVEQAYADDIEYFGYKF